MLNEGESISFPLVVSCIGFEQQSFSCTSPSLQCLATTAKGVLSFISMLSSRATLKTYAAFNATICSSFTSLAMYMMRLSIVRVEQAYPSSSKLWCFCLVNHQTRRRHN